MMGTKKLLNTSSSPPHIAYKRHNDKCDEEPQLLRQQISNHQHSENTKANNNTNTTCLLQKQTTNKMLTKIKNYFTQLRTVSTSALSATQKHCSQQQRKRHQHQHYRHQKLTECNSIPIVQNTSNMLSMLSIVVTLVFLASINGVAASPIFVDNPSLAQFQSGRNIRHLPCIVRKSGRSGVCMFAIDCIKQNGTHLGTCIDRFYFGSCCDIKEQELTEIADNSIDQNTISHHFTSDSSTLPTSALFKLTTSTPLQDHDNITTTSATIISNTNSIGSTGAISSSNIITTQQDLTQILNAVTQSFVANSLNNTQRPTNVGSKTPLINTTTTTTTKPKQQTPTTAAAATTTTTIAQKPSHFVIRTTTKPTKYTTGVKPSHNTTIKRKTTPSTTTKKAATTTTTTSTTTTATTTRMTTTKQPILTTTDITKEKENLLVETTTLPTKLFTYQIVETTAYTPTEEATNIFDFVTTDRIVPITTKMPQRLTTILSPEMTTTKQQETTTSSPETVTTQKLTTIKVKPQTTTRKPTTTKKPTSMKRTTTVRPTRRPITATTTNPTELKVSANHNTETQNFTTTTTDTVTTILNTNKTTLSPRPRPKPTASIVKVTRPTTTSTTTSTTLSSTTEKEKIDTTRSSATKKPITTTTPSTTTTTTPATTAATTTTTTTAATTTTHRTTATTTHKTTPRPSISSTTHKPGLVTWTNIDGKPVDGDEPSISDWVPLTSQMPIIIHNKIEELPNANVTYEEMDVSVSSSVSAVMNNTTIIISPPQKPIHFSKPPAATNTPSTTSTTATTTESSLTTFKPNTTSSSSSSAASTSSTTEPQESSTTAETSIPPFTTEGFSSTTTTSPSGAVSTEEITTEGVNLNSTTSAPLTGLEGVDYRQVCGRRMFPEPRIVGGSNAAFGRWPWQISLRQWRTSTYLHKCGAALLNENWAITAAHCVDNVPPSDLLLRLGEYDLAEEEEPYGYQERRVQIVASHPQFDPRTFEYDLALLRFYEPVVFQPNIIPVCVPENDEDFISQTAFVTGWGRLYEDGPLPSVLQEVAVPVINNTICESMYRAAGYIEHIPHIFICAGWKKGGYDSCEGDSGGPMVLQRESDKRFQLGGVISWGIGCAEANQPGVYTRISEFRDWINQILQF